LRDSVSYGERILEALQGRADQRFLQRTARLRGGTGILAGRNCSVRQKNAYAGGKAVGGIRIVDRRQLRSENIGLKPNIDSFSLSVLDMEISESTSGPMDPQLMMPATNCCFENERLTFSCKSRYEFSKMCWIAVECRDRSTRRSADSIFGCQRRAWQSRLGSLAFRTYMLLAHPKTKRQLCPKPILRCLQLCVFLNLRRMIVCNYGGVKSSELTFPSFLRALALCGVAGVMELLWPMDFL